MNALKGENSYPLSEHSLVVIAKDAALIEKSYEDAVNVIRIIGSYSSKSEPTEYDEQIEQLQQSMMTLVEDSAKEECADEMFDKEYRVIADEIKELKKKMAKLIRERQLAGYYDQRLQDMEGYMKKTS